MKKLIITSAEDIQQILDIVGTQACNDLARETPQATIQQIEILETSTLDESVNVKVQWTTEGQGLDTPLYERVYAVHLVENDFQILGLL